MTLDELPHAFATFVNSAHAIFDREVENVQKALAASNAEKASAQTALSEFQDQCKSAQDQLELTTRELRGAAGLVGVAHDIKEARKELTRIRSETAEATKALDKLVKERTAREAEVKALGAETRRLVAVRTESETVMANLRAQLHSVQFRTVAP